MSYTVRLSAAARRGVHDVGAKAATLAGLAQCVVPDGFVVTAGAFAVHMAKNGVDLHGDPSAVPDGATVARLRQVPLDPELAAEIRAAFDALPTIDGRSPTCVVRSSAVGEDGATASFAGQHATYYYVTHIDLEQRIVDCWLSVWSREARSYRARFGVRDAVSMAVIVQLMIPAEVSGVAFTRDPTGRRRDSIVVESSWGLGAALVDGRVTPDAYVVRRSDHVVVERRIGSKRFKVAEDLLDASATRLQGVARHLQRVSTLSDEALRDVVALAESCERQLGAPQDVEWAYANDTLYLLQSRPITTPAAGPATPPGRWVVFKPVLENFTDALTPLTVDILRRVLPPFGRFIDGRYYLDFDALQNTVPLMVSDAELVDLALLKTERRGYKLHWPRLLKGVAALFVGYVGFGSLWVRSRHVPLATLDDFRTRCTAMLDDAARDPVDTLRELFVGPGPFAVVSQFPFQVNVSAARYFLLFDALRALLQRFAPNFDLAHLAALCAGTDAMISTRLIDDLRELARVAERTPSVRQLLQSDRFDELPNQLAAHPDGGPFVAALETFIARYGHRGTREIELAAPRWQEDPTPLFVMIRNVLREGSEKRSIDAAYARREKAAAALNDAIRSRTIRIIARALARRIRYYTTLRENTRHYTTLALFAVRTKILQLEQHLVAAGLLRSDDVFYLTWDELRSIQTLPPDKAHLQELIRSRRLLQARRNRMEPPLTINVDYRPPKAVVGVLTGQCASPGIAEGTVRLVLDPATDGEIKSGEILVAPYTDPAWTPLFLSAAAIVVEVGSYLSHAGTVARELGIPCLVDVTGVMAALRNGQRICVDATQGQAFLLADIDAGGEASP